jgi:alpha-tubulin suppressor-like RCC1 family protein
VFTRTEGDWSQQAKLIADDAQADDNFGFSVALEGDTALIGARFEDEGGNDAGAAYVFTRTDDDWRQQAKLIADDAQADNEFGFSVAIEGDAALIGAPGDEGGDRAGAAYVFDGSNNSGESDDPPSSEVDSRQGSSPASSVSAGRAHTCALLENGNVHCWGFGEHGQTEGYGGGDATQVDAGYDHNCALLENGNVECWGRDNKGQSDDYEGGDATHVSTGNKYTCARLNDGDVRCWGRDLDKSEDYTGGDATDVSAGSGHTCAPVEGGDAHCWGGPGGSVKGFTDDYQEGDAIDVSAGQDYTCVLREDGDVYCWGENDRGRADGYESGDATELSATWKHTCVLLENGNLECWGSNEYGEGEDLRDENAVDVAAGNMHTCAVLENGNVHCWGLNDDGQAEDYTVEDSAETDGEDEANDNQNWKLKLAKRFSPVLAFHSEEVYRPMPADYALERSDLRNQNGNLLREGPIQTPPTTDEFQAFLDNKHIPLGPSGPDGESTRQSPDIAKKAFRSAADDYPETVHARVLYTSSPDQPEEDDRWDAPDTKPPSSTRIIKDPDVRPPDSTVIQYWIYYPYNDWINQHEGEWEMVQVNLPRLLGPSDVEKTDLPVPSSVFYSIHHGGAALDWDDDNLRTAEDLVEDGYALPPPSEVDAGPSVFPYQEKPAVVVAKGSHASYPNEHYGRIVCSDAAEDLEIGDILVDYELEIIEEDDPSWVGFPGSWGAVPQATNAPDADGPGPQPDPQLGWGPGPPGPQFSEARDIRPGIDATNKWEAPLSWAGAQSSGKIICNASGSSLLAEDDQGRQVGFDGDRVKSEIPGAVPLAVSKGQVDDEVEIYYLPDGHNYTVEIDGYTTAKANLTMSSLKGGQAEITRFESVPVSAQYRGSFDVPNEGPPSPIQEDTDGDGEVDNVREPTSHETVELSSAAAEADGIGLGTIPQFVLFVLILAGGAGLAVWLSRR